MCNCWKLWTPDTVHVLGICSSGTEPILLKKCTGDSKPICLFIDTES